MKKLTPLFLMLTTAAIFSCQKEFSEENGAGDSNLIIIGANCRINKIAYVDNNTNQGVGSLSAIINDAGNATDITKFDSIGSNTEFNATPIYINDTIHINANEYFIIDMATQRIKKMRGLTDPLDPSSEKFDADYLYDATGYLIKKTYELTNFPGIPLVVVNYTHTGGNLTYLSAIELLSGDLLVDADISYFNNIFPQNFLYLFLDETQYANFHQFYNFGLKPKNAPRDVKIRSYDPGNIPSDSLVSSFSNYVMSIDNYVLSVLMEGDHQPGIPAIPKKLTFSYKCK